MPAGISPKRGGIRLARDGGRALGGREEIAAKDAPAASEVARYEVYDTCTWYQYTATFFSVVIYR